MRQDNRTQLPEELAEQLLDHALANRSGVEPRLGLEARVLANLRQQRRAAQPISWSLAPVMIVVIAALALFAIEHRTDDPVASEPALVAALPGGGVATQPDVRPPQAGERGVVVGEAKRVKAAAAKRRTATLQRQDLALDLHARRVDELAEGGLQVTEVRIAEVRLDDIVISSNER